MATKPLRFRLSPNVAEEINSLPPEALPRYLVHRYRYEVYPALHIADEYPLPADRAVLDVQLSLCVLFRDR